jgi:hypothetical protein
MKKVLFFLAILFISLTTVKGQTNIYHPFPTHDAIWRQFSGYSPIPNYVAYEYLIAGDTNISSKIYHKLTRISANYAITLTGMPDLNNLGATYQSYYGAFREDTILKKVFYMPYWNPNEQLLYDFNLQLGDTLSGVNHGNHTYVGAVDSILIGTDYRRRLGIVCELFSNYPYVYLIEGIGSTSGLVEPIDIPFEGYSILYCFTQNEIHLYQSSDMNSTCDFLSVNENESNKYFSISPNPFSQSTQITLNQNYHSIALAVYDIQGKQVAQQQYKDCDKIQLNRNQLSNGLYFLKLTLDDKEVETGKVIISKE